ncbi:Protein YceI [Streptomyces badius]
MAQPPQSPDPGDWDIEPNHSQIGFTARHIGLARIHGRFNAFAGAVRIADRMEDSAMHVIIDAASIDTNVQMRDDHLRFRQELPRRRPLPDAGVLQRALRPPGR